jgi:hypothetical protein
LFLIDDVEEPRGWLGFYVLKIVRNPILEMADAVEFGGRSCGGSST